MKHDLWHDMVPIYHYLFLYLRPKLHSWNVRSPFLIFCLFVTTFTSWVLRSHVPWIIHSETLGRWLSMSLTFDKSFLITSLSSRTSVVNSTWNFLRILKLFLHLPFKKSLLRVVTTYGDESTRRPTQILSSLYGRPQCNSPNLKYLFMTRWL